MFLFYFGVDCAFKIKVTVSIRDKEVLTGCEYNIQCDDEEEVSS